MGSQFYACRHIWHCTQCQFSYGLSILCVSAHLALETMPILPMGSQFYACRHIWHCSQCQFSYGLSILCVSAHLALFTMPVLLWALNSMRVGTFGIVHNATSSY